MGQWEGGQEDTNHTHLNCFTELWEDEESGESSLYEEKPIYKTSLDKGD